MKGAKQKEKCNKWHTQNGLSAIWNVGLKYKKELPAWPPSFLHSYTQTTYSLCCASTLKTRSSKIWFFGVKVHRDFARTCLAWNLNIIYYSMGWEDLMNGYFFFLRSWTSLTKLFLDWARRAKMSGEFFFYGVEPALRSYLLTEREEQKWQETALLPLDRKRTPWQTDSPNPGTRSENPRFGGKRLTTKQVESNVLPVLCYCLLYCMPRRWGN